MERKYHRNLGLRGLPLNYLLVLIPIGLYFLILNWFALNIPWSDDFIFILEPITRDHDFLSEVIRVHGNYILVLQKLIIYTWYEIFNQFNFKYLIFFSNISIVAILWLYWKISRTNNFLSTTALAFLLFNLKYYESTFWALTGLIAHWTALAVLLSFYFLEKFVSSKRVEYLFASQILATLSMFSFGNGFLTPLIGMFFLFARKNKYWWKWALLNITLVVFYFAIVTPKVSSVDSIGLAIDILSILKSFLALTGSIFNFSSFGLIFSVITGLLSFAFLAIIFLRYKYLDVNPTNSLIIFFLVSTLALISLGRTVPEANMPVPLLKSRYFFWVSLLWCSILVAIFDLCSFKKRLIPVLILVFFCSINLMLLRSNLPFIRNLNQNLKSGVVEFKIDSTLGLLRTIASNEYVNQILKESIQKGVYHIPDFEIEDLASERLKSERIDDLFRRANTPIEINELKCAEMDGIRAILIKPSTSEFNKDNFIARVSNGEQISYYKCRPPANHIYEDVTFMMAYIPSNAVNRSSEINFLSTDFSDRIFISGLFKIDCEMIGSD